MITREEAKELMYDLINSGILSDEIETKLQDVANAIEYEQYGLHMWGASDEDVYTLAVSMRTDIPEYLDFLKKQQVTEERHRFVPSEYEQREENDFKKEEL